MKTLVIANEKGGVGKSTLTANLAFAAMERQGLRILLVDMDRQGSLSLTFPPAVGAPKRSLKASMLFGRGGDGLKPEALSEHAGIVRADKDLLAVDMGGDIDVMAPRTALAALAPQYDLCLMDTPPTLGMRLIASLAAADFLVTPVSMGLYEKAGVEELIRTIATIRNTYNKKMNYMGILPMKTNMRRRSEVEQLAELKAEAGSSMMDVHLPERAAVRNAVDARMPVWLHGRGASDRKAAAEWRSACNLILDRVLKK